jgi:hypothetical protein
MTTAQEKMQTQLHAAYKAFAANPTDTRKADAYDTARAALIDALDTPAHKALRAAVAAWVAV